MTHICTYTVHRAPVIHISAWNRKWVSHFTQRFKTLRSLSPASVEVLWKKHKKLVETCSESLAGKIKDFIQHFRLPKWNTIWCHSEHPKKKSQLMKLACIVSNGWLFKSYPFCKFYSPPVTVKTHYNIWNDQKMSDGAQTEGNGLR